MPPRRRPPAATGAKAPAPADAERPAPAPSQQRSKKPTDAEARRAVKRVLVEVFDVPAVLRRRKPLSELAGLWSVLGSVGMIFVNMVITSIRQNNSRRIVGTMYLRNTSAFVASLLQQAGLSVAYQIVSAASWWFRTRINIQWRKHLVEKLHGAYFSDMVYYRQTTWDDSIPDPAQRIVSDVMMLLDNYDSLSGMVQSYLSESLGAAHSVWRLWVHIPEQRWLSLFVIAWSWGNLTFRNYFAPAMMRATLMAKSSRVSGMYRDAQSKLAQHAERIIAFVSAALPPSPPAAFR